MVKDLFKRLTGGSKTREYNIKSLRAVKRNLKRRMMTDKNKVSGVDVIGYHIKNYQQKRAIIRFEGGIKLKACFVEFHEKEKAMNCFHATHHVNHQSILAPIFLSYNEKKHKTLLFYQRYDSLLNEWREENEIWWQQAMCEQIQAINYMHDKGFIHTGLDDPTNYALKDNKLKMLNITSSLQDYLEKHPQTDGERIKRDNFASFRDLMRQRYMEIKCLTRDDEAFFQLFDRVDLKYEELVHKLITHPYCMDSRKYMLCFQRIQLANERGYLEVNLEDLTKGQEFLQYENWIETIQNSNVRHLKDALPKDLGKRKGKYNDEKLESLVTLLRNIVEHKHGEGSQNLNHQQITKYYEEVAAEVKGLFPGFLTLLLEKVRIDPRYYSFFLFESV